MSNLNWIMVHMFLCGGLIIVVPHSISGGDFGWAILGILAFMLNFTAALRLAKNE